MTKNEIDQFLTTMLISHKGVSDLNITVGRPFQVETDGVLMPVETNPPIENLTAFQTEIFVLNMINSDRRLTKNLISAGSCDLSYYLPGKARFRVNIFSQRQCYSSVLRRLETIVPTIADLNLPKVFLNIAKEKNGIVLVTGATGSGKSTSLAALLDAINETQPVHIVTLEDPVEFVHSHKVATFNQRELGTDFDSFAGGLRAALRQAPKIILVGEMRDRETVEIAMSAAETGHLVFSTLHTVDAGQTINRIIGMFDSSEESQIRVRLADTVRWIVGQRLLPRVGGGRVAVFEILYNNIRSKEVILNGESENKSFYDIISQGETHGMKTFDSHILEQFQQKIITDEAAMAYASRKPVVGRGIDYIKASRGEKTTDIEDLGLDTSYSQSGTTGPKGARRPRTLG
ncbi:MAG: PilT/PilU family type 4a pilus ATPase [Deltaproteobacteria bacterium]|nr:PilT/PilU family type 4a pilus ATPase [Deltaproteobacteria bacterium]